MPKKSTQIATRNNFRPENDQTSALIRIPDDTPDGLVWWAEQYFRHEVTTSQASQKVQRRDLDLFIRYMVSEEKTDDRPAWTPRLSRDFQQHLRTTLESDGQRRWNDKTVVRVLAHLKTFAKWVHQWRPFPLDNPMDRLKLPAVGVGLDVEKALTPAERRRVLDAADMLTATGGKSKDRKRFKGKERPTRKGYRPYRNRAIVYTLIETGMRRAAIIRLNVTDIDFQRRTIAVEEKGGYVHTYQISREGAHAIRDYIETERDQDAARWQSGAVFLPAATVPKSTGRLDVWTVNQVWNAVCQTANVKGKTPHSARHTMGKHIMEKTGNIAAVQRQLGHRNAAYSMQYARVTHEEMDGVLNER
ncbi:site-specific integrase [Candidatus Woesearchaeota archaeon]|nr:site-specific integrase [Candidatus Woesearchaeota archaeon]